MRASGVAAAPRMPERENDFPTVYIQRQGNGAEPDEPRHDPQGKGDRACSKLEGPPAPGDPGGKVGPLPAAGLSVRDHGRDIRLWMEKIA